jgi:hypothetical protein
VPSGRHEQRAASARRPVRVGRCDDPGGNRGALCNEYRFALAVLAVAVAIVIAGMVGLDREAKGIRFGGAFARS